MPGRTTKPFIAINCSAIPKDLMESEIFGHVRGAFTGASENRAGAAELADGGTLFLDEVTEMDLGLQAKLLRFVQTGTLPACRRQRNETGRCAHRLGDEPRPVRRCRRRAASAPTSSTACTSCPFICLPLRERRDDILPLAEAFLARFAEEEGRAFTGFEAEAATLLKAHAWPGNVRQLANVIRRVVVLDDGAAVSAAMLPEPIRATEAGVFASRSDASPQGQLPVRPYHEQERAILKAAITAFDGNIARAAAALEISPSTIYRKLQSWSGGTTVEA